MPIWGWWKDRTRSEFDFQDGFNLGSGIIDLVIYLLIAVAVISVIGFGIYIKSPHVFR